MRASKWYRGLTASLAACMLAGMHSSSTTVSDYKLGYNTNANENGYISTVKLPKGAIGKSMSIPFHIRAADEDMEDPRINPPQTNRFQQMKKRGNGDYSVDYYPFEIMETIFVAKSVGTIKKGNVKSMSLSVRMRRDTLQGYYSIPVLLEWNGGSDTDYINVWVSTSSTSGADEEGDKKKGNCLVVDEDQPTPRGVHPNIMGYTVNFRNKRETTTQDMTVSMRLSEDGAKFPFEIDDDNYDHTFERMQPGETVLALYSMAIRRDSYTDYYPIKHTTTFHLGSEGNLHTGEGTFYVRIVSKDKEDDLGDFNAGDRIRARLIVENYHTVPEKIYARDEFEPIPNVKNAPTSAPANNILFNLESEEVSDSVVFTAESGTSSLVVGNMAPGQTAEIRTRFTARVGVDQRSYAIAVKERCDSPEFKNAEESIVVDIPVKQYARLSTSTIDVIPNSLTIGSESNVMFSINNMGKVIPYNMAVTSEADFVKTTDAYVGNIKLGETDNMDTMLTGVAPTLDKGTMRIRTDYEDEGGVPAKPMERELTLMVMEEMEQSWDDVGAAMDAGSMDAEAAPSFWSKYKFLVVAGVVAAAGIAAAVVIRIRKKYKTAREEDVGDEIS